jgi:hypothetical protein
MERKRETFPVPHTGNGNKKILYFFLVISLSSTVILINKLNQGSRDKHHMVFWNPNIQD